PAGSDHEGILDPGTADLSHALPAGLLFLDTTLDPTDRDDSLGHPAAAPLHAAWATHGPAISTKRGLRGWLAHDFFKTVHKGMYENRPIHWPLSSAKRSFVAWVNIHRFTDQTLHILLADHLVPTLTRIEGALTDLRAARDSTDTKAARAAEKQYDRVLKARDELQAFILDVETCADQGPPSTGSKCPPRERDARYAPDLDDGVMINSAALWPLLLPQWKDPKKWWTEPQGLRLVPPRHALLAHPRGREVPARPQPGRRPRLLLAHPPRTRLGLGAAPARRDRAGPRRRRQLDGAD
ncbi:MAG: hypothetical protein GXP62_18665, partial [Oligoflexia bacterium]|nr:hypothetical protein [Oligoflexia bacterium]